MSLVELMDLLARRKAAGLKLPPSKSETKPASEVSPALRAHAAFLRDFQPDAAIIEDRPIGIPVYATLYVLAGLLVIAILWAFIGALDRIVVAPGKVATIAPVLVLQPYSVSKIVSINVKPGVRVKKGEALMSFDPAFAKADESTLASKVMGLNASVERMEAEIDGQSFDAGPNPPPERATQAEIFQRRQTQLASELAERDSKLASLGAQTKSNAESVKDLTQQIALAHKVTVMREELWHRGVSSDLQYATAQREELDVKLRLKEATTQGDDLKQQIQQTQADRESYLSNWRRELNEDMAKARQDAKEASDSLVKAERMQDFTALRAPVDGVVLEVAERSIGSVLREAETAITLVPIDAPLQVEVDVPSRDVGYVAVGNKVRVKLEAYPFQKFGTLEGRLTVVSPDSVIRQSDKGEPQRVVFPAVVHLRDTAKTLELRGIRLGPGLVATAEITTGKRSIASYILYPIWRMFDEGMKEP